MVNDVGANSLEKLLNDGWGYHDTESDRLARELEAAVGQGGVAPEFLIGFLHLSIHTLGHHLADWPRALALAERALDGQAPAAETGRAWRWLYVAAVLAADSLEAAIAELSYLKAAGDKFGAASDGYAVSAGRRVDRREASPAMARKSTVARSILRAYAFRSRRSWTGRLRSPATISAGNFTRSRSARRKRMRS